MNISNTLLKQIILEQQPIRLPDNYFERSAMEKVQRYRGNDQIIIISGLRRCGKSTLLQQIRKLNPEPEYYINFDDDRLVQFTLEDFQLLLETFIELFGVKSTFYFDEIQNVPGWERFIRRLQDQNKKIYITGSNARMLSQELGTHLTGRYLQIEMYPYSFLEWTTHYLPALTKKEIYTTEEKGLLKKLFNDYFQKGGIPEFIKRGERDYLHTLYESILYRDVLTRFKPASEKALKELVFYLASHLGKEISYNALYKMLGLASANTVSDYCEQLFQSYLCFFINRYDFSLKKQLYYAKKNYFIDTALARAVGFYVSEDRGRIFENIVFLELKRHFNEVYFYKQKTECDFILRQGAKVIKAIQVCMDWSNPKTQERELNGLKNAMLDYRLKEGLIITEDTDEQLKITQEDQTYLIHIVPIWKWLINSENL